jgi:hypothetical protein
MKNLLFLSLTLLLFISCVQFPSKLKNKKLYNNGDPNEQYWIEIDEKNIMTIHIGDKFDGKVYEFKAKIVDVEDKEIDKWLSLNEKSSNKVKNIYGLEFIGGNVNSNGCATYQSPSDKGPTIIYPLFRRGGIEENDILIEKRTCGRSVEDCSEYLFVFRENK